MKTYALVKKCLVCVVVVFGLLLGGCASTEQKVNTISLGMDKQQVIDVLGPPDNSRATEDVEYLVYQLTTPRTGDQINECAFMSAITIAGLFLPGPCARSNAEYFVQFKQGKVTAYGKVGDFGSPQDLEAIIDLNQTVKEAE